MIDLGRPGRTMATLIAIVAV